MIWIRLVIILKLGNLYKDLSNKQHLFIFILPLLLSALWGNSLSNIFLEMVLSRKYDFLISWWTLFTFVFKKINLIIWIILSYKHAEYNTSHFTQKFILFHKLLYLLTTLLFMCIEIFLHHKSAIWASNMLLFWCLILMLLIKCIPNSIFRRCSFSIFFYYDAKFALNIIQVRFK